MENYESYDILRDSQGKYRVKTIVGLIFEEVDSWGGSEKECIHRVFHCDSLAEACDKIKAIRKEGLAQIEKRG